MADKVLAKFGPGQGPWVRIPNMERPRVLVSGLVHGIVSIVAHGPGMLRQVIEEDGEIEIPVCEKVRIHHEGQSANLMVFIIGG